MPTTKADLYLSLGSNLGDREANLKAALTALNRSYGRYTRLSRILETEPVGFSSPHPFLNLCVRYRINLRSGDALQECLRLLQRVKTIESQLGREQKVEWDCDGQRIYHDRPIDIDILFLGDYCCSSSLITVPHPRIGEREFVLRPLREIATPTLRRTFPEYF